VDGQDYPYRLHDGYLELSIPIEAGKTSDVAIQYKNDLNSAAIDISKNSIQVYLLRTASDFRDIHLRRNATGSALIALYYGDGMKRVWTLVWLSVIVVLCVGALYVRGR